MSETRNSLLSTLEREAYAKQSLFDELGVLERESRGRSISPAGDLMMGSSDSRSVLLKQQSSLIDTVCSAPENAQQYQKKGGKDRRRKVLKSFLWGSSPAPAKPANDMKQYHIETSSRQARPPLSSYPRVQAPALLQSSSSAVAAVAKYSLTPTPTYTHDKVRHRSESEVDAKPRSSSIESVCTAQSEAEISNAVVFFDDNESVGPMGFSSVASKSPKQQAKQVSPLLSVLSSSLPSPQPQPQPQPQHLQCDQRLSRSLLPPPPSNDVGLLEDKIIAESVTIAKLEKQRRKYLHGIDVTKKDITECRIQWRRCWARYERELGAMLLSDQAIVGEG